MATLREAITGRIEDLTAQVARIKDNAATAIAPLQTRIQSEEQKLVSFAPFLDQDLTIVRARLNTLIDGYSV